MSALGLGRMGMRDFYGAQEAKSIATKFTAPSSSA